MSTNYRLSNAKLGALVIGGLLFLVFTLYMIGKNENIFGASITVVSVIDDVAGLIPGNNVRYKGMNVGTVKSVEMGEGGKIYVTAYVEKKMRPFIRKDDYTGISTDGLMGNKLLVIYPSENESRQIEEGDTLFARREVGIDNLMDKLDESGAFLTHTLSNLAEVSDRLVESSSLWELLADKTLTEDIRDAVASLREVGQQARQIAQAGNAFVQQLEQGQGLVSSLFTDTVMVADMEQAVSNIRQGSSQAVTLMAELEAVLQKVDEGKGPAGLLLTDSLARESLLSTLQNIEQSTYHFNQNMEALKHNFLFRKYFRRQERKNAKPAAE